MVNTYILVNPHIEGSVKGNAKANNSIEAAKIIYNNLSEHFNNNIPKFLFTIQKGTSGKGKYYSFLVNEKKIDNEINFSIQTYNIKNSNSAYKGMKEKINSYKKIQSGGKSKKKVSDTKSHDTKSSDKKSSDTKSSDTKSSDKKSSDTKSSDKKSSDKKSSDKKSSDTKSSDTKSSDKDYKFKETLIHYDDDTYLEDLVDDEFVDEFDDSPKNNTKIVQKYVPNTSYPIYRWYYDPYVYNLDSLYIPTFYSYITPYIQIDLRP